MRADFKDRLLECLGGPWPEPCPLEPRVEETSEHDGYRLEKITYQVEPGERVPAWLLVPTSATKANPAPAVCVWHQHNGAYGIGKTEPAGLGGSPMHHTGVHLAKEGYVVLCPDAAGFGERQVGKFKGSSLERYLFCKYVSLGQCLAWKNILDMRRAVDYITSRPEVQADRLGCYGHSMGSTHSYLIGPWEPRIRAVVGNCCFPTLAAINRVELLHCFPNYIPGLLKYGDVPDMAALIAPRALHLNLGETDHGTPLEEANAGFETIARAYEAVHAEDNFTWFIEPGVGHDLTPAMWDRVKQTFAKHLKS